MSGGLSLTMSVNASVFPNDRELDIGFTGVFTNQQAVPVTLYTGAAQLWVTGGWLSPVLTLEFVPSGSARPAKAVLLRDYYGPPPQPPMQSYFDANGKVLKPGESAEYPLKACWIPASRLESRHLDARTIDPEGMDGLAQRPVPGHSVLVLGRTCKDMKAERRKRADFLRQNPVVFFPGPGVYRLRMRYAQTNWGSFFTPKTPADLHSGWSEVKLR